MVGQIRIYFEGDKALRSGFLSFFSAVRELRGRIKLIAGGARPIEDFMVALETHRDSFNVLLVDAEGPDDGTLLAKLRAGPDSRGRWDPPLGAHVSEDQVHFMVQVMEAWFLADRETLRAYYGRELRENQLPANPEVEEVPKEEVLSGLRGATEKTQKGPYHKTRHAPGLLGRLDATRARAAARACERLFATLSSKLTE
jgi:hypothetical protein